MRVERYARWLLGLATVAFLVAGDVQAAPAAFWAAARLAFLGAALVAALPLALRHRRSLAALFRAPLLFFSLFALLDLVAAAAAAHPAAALRYAVGYLVIEVLAVVIACAFREQLIVSGILAALAIKVVASVALAWTPEAWWMGERFRGLLGNPNPMAATAGLTYLVTMLSGWYDWPRAVPRALLVAVGLTATSALAVSRSLSGLFATVVTMGTLAWFAGRGETIPGARRAWRAISSAMLVPVVVVLLFQPARTTAPTRSIGFRARWWGALEAPILRHPWIGYGPGGTRALAVEAAPPWRSSAHNLYLEATISAGVPGGVMALLFVVAASVAVFRRVRQSGGGHLGAAAVMLFYAMLSPIEPVLLNGAPSSLVAPLVVAAICVVGADGLRHSAEPAPAGDAPSSGVATSR
jgi:O-antigen ligase